MTDNPFKSTAFGVTNGIGGAVAIALAVYLGVIVINGNSANLAAALNQDFWSHNGRDGFGKWALAIIILLALASSDTLRPFVAPIYFTTLVAILIKEGNSGKLFSTISGYWQAL